MERVSKQIKYNISNRNQSIKYIVIHDTGNPSAGADAKAHFNYFNGGNRASSADIFVDDSSVWTVNDYHKYYTWHVGDGRGRFGITNANSVGIEMCINHDGSYEKAMQNTITVTRELMEELNIPISRVIRHYDASRKNCPASMSGNNWNRGKVFLSELKNKGDVLNMTQYEELKNELKELVETVKILTVELHDVKNPMIYNYIDENMPEWARASVQKAINKGIIKGEENGLNLTYSDLRSIVREDRAGLFD